MLPRAITSPEHARIQLDGQWVELLACIPIPATVYTARVNGAPAGTDRVVELDMDGEVGDLADVIPGMTVFIGSSAGGYERGQARVRKAPITGKLYIGTESELAIADNDYLTVVDEFSLWSKRVRIDAGVIYMDEDVVYSGQHAAPLPVVVMGGPVILELVSDMVTAIFDASGSWVPGGGAATYLWDAPGADAIDDDTAAAVEITYSAAGRFRVGCTVTIGGVPNTRYEYVNIFDADNPPATQFQVRAISGSKAEGGYSLQMTMFADADQASVRDRAEVLIFTRDHYGADGQVSMGYATGRENILARAWIEGETILWSSEVSSVVFAVSTAHAWLNRITAYPQGLEDVTTTPALWVDFNTLTMTAYVWHLLTWRSTVAQAVDCIVEQSATRVIELAAAATTLWEQLVVTAGQRLLAPPCCDHLSRLFVLIDSQLRTDRSGVVEVMTLETADWRIPIQINRVTVPPVGMVDLNGFAFDGTTATALFALAPGREWKHYGRAQSVQALLLTDQAQANALAGLIAGQANNPYPTIPLQLAANNRFLDIAPDCYALLTLPAADNPRGIGLSAVRMIPRRIGWSYDADSGGLLPSIDFEAESFPELSITGDAPAVDPEPPPDPPPDDSCPTGYHWDADAATCVADGGASEGDGNTVYVLTADFLGCTHNFLDPSPNWVDKTGALPGAMDAFDVDKFDPIHVGYVMSNVHGIYMTENLDASPPTWVLVISKGDIQTEVGQTFLGIYTLSTSTQGARGLGIGAGYKRVSDDQQFAISIGFSASPTLGAVGFNWHEIANGGSGDFDVKTYLQLSNWVPSLAFAAPCVNGRFGGVYKFNVGLAEWELLEDLTPAFDELALGGDFAFAGGDGAGGERTMYLYSAGSGGKIWRNQNYGRSTPGPTGWTEVLNIVAAGFGAASRFQFGGHYFNVATLNELDVMAAIPNDDPGSYGLTLLRSTDGGDTWSGNFFAGTGMRDGHDLARWPYDPERVFFLTDAGSLGSGGILYSENGGTDLDDYATTDKTGDWATVFGASFASPKTIIPISIAT